MVDFYNLETVPHLTEAQGVSKVGEFDDMLVSSYIAEQRKLVLGAQEGLQVYTVPPCLYVSTLKSYSTELQNVMNFVVGT
jgi:hypothetical protein